MNTKLLRNFQEILSKLILSEVLSFQIFTFCLSIQMVKNEGKSKMGKYHLQNLLKEK